MRKTGIFIFSLLFISAFTNAHAGWYECYNYAGNIGNAAITFSIQVREGYFGETEKKDFNINGVYKYEKYNNPIRLEGKIDFKNKKGFLYELQNNERKAIFEFDYSEEIIKGTWKDLSTKRSTAFKLHFVSKLIDTSESNLATNISILQAVSFPEFYFVGIYSKKANSYSSFMSELQVYKKSDKSLWQSIDFSKIETATGNISTLISDNIQITDSTKQQIIVTNDIGRIGGYLILTYNNKKKRFILNPTPTTEGGD